MLFKNFINCQFFIFLVGLNEINVLQSEIIWIDVRVNLKKKISLL